MGNKVSCFIIYGLLLCAVYLSNRFHEVDFYLKAGSHSDGQESIRLS